MIAVYTTPPVIIFRDLEIYHQGGVYCGGVVYTIPPVMK